MPRLPKLLVGLTALALLAVPLAISASAQASTLTASQSAVAAGAVSRETWIRYLDFSRLKGYGSTTAIRGQVAVRTPDGPRAVRDIPVQVYRRQAGSDVWRYLATRRTGSDRGIFVFRTDSVANATYKVVYRGGQVLARSADTARVLVHRSVRSTLEDRTGVFSGRVTPRYAHRDVLLERRTCGACSWQRIRSTRTGDYGRFRFEVGAPSTGRWYWRATVPASTRYIRSYSAVYSTELD